MKLCSERLNHVFQLAFFNSKSKRLSGILILGPHLWNGRIPTSYFTFSSYNLLAQVLWSTWLEQASFMIIPTWSKLNKAGRNWMETAAKVGVYSCGISAPILLAFVTCADCNADPPESLSGNIVFYVPWIFGPFTVSTRVTAKTCTGSSVPGADSTILQK